MPDFKTLKSKDRKKIDVTEYLKDILSDGDTAWMTLVKIPQSVKSKMKVRSLAGVQGKVSQKMFELQIKSQAENRNLDNSDIAKIMSDLTPEETEGMTAISYEIELTKLRYGLSSSDHNFTVEGKQIELDDVFYDEFIMPREELKNYLLSEIDNFNDPPVLGERMPSN